MTALWTAACLTFPALDALKDGYDVYMVVDAVGGTSAKAHEAAVRRLEQAGAMVIGRLINPLFDWGHLSTPAITSVISFTQRFPSKSTASLVGEISPLPSLPETRHAPESVPLIQAADLTVTHAPAIQPIIAVNKASFAIAPGEIVGLLGESGCGKSTLALSLLGLLAPGARAEGSILLRGQDLFSLTEPQLRKIRGAQISLIHQEPGLSLSPVMRVGTQISDVIYAHRDCSRQVCKDEAMTALQQMRLPDPDRIYRSYPHQLSGGQLHRVAIAQALCCSPDLVVSDEATRSLDATLQAEVIDLFRERSRASGAAHLFITHNPLLLPGFAHRVLVMHQSEIVEQGNCSELFRRPSHPYTRVLLEMARAAGHRTRGQAAGAGR